MRVLRPVSENGAIVGYAFHCPGCEHGHWYCTAGVMTWQFNGDLQRPTFSPSLLNTCDPHPDPKMRRCHLFVTDGRIHFCTDCTHDMAGKTVDMVDVDA